MNTDDFTQTIAIYLPDNTLQDQIFLNNELFFQARCKAFENEHLTFYFTWLPLVYLVGSWNENV